MNSLEATNIIIGVNKNSNHNFAVELATTAASQGSHVAIIGPSVDSINKKIEAVSALCFTLQCDLNNESSCDATITELASKWSGKVDAYINLLSLPDDGCLLDIESNHLHGNIGSNICDQFISCRSVARVMKKSPTGSIVNILPWDISVKNLNSSYYTFVRESSVALSKSLAQALASSGIRVNSINPGFIYSEPTHGEISFEACEEAIHKVPMKRCGRSNDLIGPALFLASNESGYITGTELLVDGGLTNIPLVK